MQKIVISHPNWINIRILALLIVVFLTACDPPPPECEPGIPRSDLASPDHKFIARLHESFCGFPGASDGWTIGIQIDGEKADPEQEVFITFESRPKYRWIDASHLEIEVTGVQTINKSERKIKGVEISYRLDNSLTLDAIKAKFTSERLANQRLMANSSDDHKYLVKMFDKNVEERSATFIKWAEEYAHLTPAN